MIEHGPGIDIFTPGKPGEYDLEGGIWEDEDARNFYENMVDLKAFVPAILFKDNEKGKDKEEAASKGTAAYTLARMHTHTNSHCLNDPSLVAVSFPQRLKMLRPPQRSWSWSSRL